MYLLNMLTQLILENNFLTVLILRPCLTVLLVANYFIPIWLWLHWFWQLSTKVSAESLV